MKNGLATIICMAQCNPLDGQIEHRSFSWSGDPKGKAMVSIYALHHVNINPNDLELGDVFNLGSLRLRIVHDYDAEYNGFEVIQDGLKAKWRATWHPRTKGFGLVYRRIILTAVVWGLAESRKVGFPNWRDVYLLDRLARFVKGRGKR